MQIASAVLASTVCVVTFRQLKLHCLIHFRR